MNELIIYASERHARNAGFHGQVMPRHEHIKAWWPDLGPRPLYGRRIQRLTFAIPEYEIEPEIMAILKMRMQSVPHPLIVHL